MRIRLRACKHWQVIYESIPGALKAKLLSETEQEVLRRKAPHTYGEPPAPP
jgi:hypothetical protein